MNTRKYLSLTLKIWRQKNRKSKGKFEIYKISGISTDLSFLEMLDILNEQLIDENRVPVAFDHDCQYCFKYGWNSLGMGRSTH